MSSLLRFKLILLLFIGVFSCVLNAEVEEPEAEELQEKHLVFVEPIPVVSKNEEKGYSLQRYGDRRGNWGFTLGAEYSAYEPVNYEPNFAIGTYRDVYGTPTTPMIELHMQVKRNFKFGSLGAEILGGTFKNGNPNPDFIGSSLQLTQVAVSLKYTMDTLFEEPYVAPYGSVGAYSMIFSESLLGQTFSGNTQPAVFLSGGFLFQVDWLDHLSSLLSYNESHLQSTYLFVEARNYMKSSAAKDPDFSTGFTYGGGMKIEF